ncbi:MAG: 3-hydroxyanthranilate 3,4-dioxygenase [Deltaproteobacteria bacterium]|nr:3-hydroxyanthranilate 3,4-dioxygenase [Deltaproteobacteria bacterium]
MPVAPPLDFQKFIDDHRHLLKPPVGNHEIYVDHEFIVMIVGGPNARTDYHVDPGEELFFQVEGDMILKIVDDGTPRAVEIKQGQLFLLPSWVPHSPQRRENTVGLVIERRRRPGELDAFEWYCEPCGTRLYREELQLGSIVKDLPPVFERYEARVEHRTCKQCGWAMPTRAEARAMEQRRAKAASPPA